MSEAYVAGGDTSRKRVVKFAFLRHDCSNHGNHATAGRMRIAPRASAGNGEAVIADLSADIADEFDALVAQRGPKP